MKRIFSLILVISMLFGCCFIASANYRDPVDGIKMQAGFNPVVMQISNKQIQYAVYIVDMENMTNCDFTVHYADNMTFEYIEVVDPLDMLAYYDTGSQVNFSLIYEENCGKSSAKLFILTFSHPGKYTVPELEVTNVAGTFIKKVADAVTVKYDGKNDLSELPDKGDVDLNGKITAADARLALRFSAKLEKLSDKQQKNADVNSDKAVTAADARKILRYSAGLEKSF